MPGVSGHEGCSGVSSVLLRSLCPPHTPAYANFYAKIDSAAAQAFVEGASQPHHAAASVGASVSSPTKIDLTAQTFYCEVGPTVGDIFACIAPSNAASSVLTAKRVRIREGTEKTLCLGRNGATGQSLYLWDA
jgi:hypothetical protein